MKRDAMPWLICAGLALWLGLSSWLHGRQVEDRDARIDSLRTVELLARLDSTHWQTIQAQTVTDLEELLQRANDSTDVLASDKAQLAQDIETLGGQLRALTDMYANAVGQIESHEATVHASDTARAAPDSVTALVDDGLLRANLSFVPPQTLGIDYRVRLALTLGWLEAPDGGVYATARASDDRVELRYGDAFYQPPDPVEFCGLGTKATWAGIGGLSAGVLRGLARAIGGH